MCLIHNQKLIEREKLQKWNENSNEIFHVYSTLFIFILIDGYKYRLNTKSEHNQSK